MGRDFEEEDGDEEPDELPEWTDELGADDEALGIEDDGDLAADEIEDGPEDVGLDVETHGGLDEDDAVDDDDETPLVLDDTPLEIEGELEDGVEEDGWTEGSEGTAGSWDDDLLDSEDGEPEDDGGLEGVDDPSIDDFADESEGRLRIDEEEESEQELERIELDLG